MASDARPHVVIVGAGFGGLEAARGLARAPVRVTVVDRRNHYLFQPLLYQVATAALSPADIAYPIRSILRRQKNADVVLAEVVPIDPDRRQVSLRDGGSALLRHPGGRVGRAARVLRPRRLGDARSGPQESRRRARDPPADPPRLRGGRPRDGRRSAGRGSSTFAIVGRRPDRASSSPGRSPRSPITSSWTTSATSTRARRASFSSRPGPRILPSYSRRAPRENAAAELRRLRVEVRTGEPVTAVDETGLVAGGRHLEAATVLWAAGVAASRVGSCLGAPVDKNGRVVGRAGPHRSRTSRDLRDRGPRPLHAPGRQASAGRQPGRHAAGASRRALDPRPPRRPGGASRFTTSTRAAWRSSAGPRRSPSSSA